MAEPLTLISSVDEGLRRGVQRAQEEASIAGRHTSSYNTFETVEADAEDSLGDMEDEKTVGCSPMSLLRSLGSTLTRREEDSLPLTERRVVSTATWYLQAFRYVPLAVRYVAGETMRKVKKAGMWMVVGLKDYANHGTYAYPVYTNAAQDTSQATFWVSVL